MSFYEELPTLRVKWRANQSLQYEEHPFKLFEKCDYGTSGDFVIIYQDKIKTVIPLIQIDTMEYPYESK